MNEKTNAIANPEGTVNAVAIPDSVAQALKAAGIDTTGLSNQEIMEFAEFYLKEIEVSREGATLRPARIKINKDACNFIDPSGQTLDELRGVIVYKQKTRGYWVKGADDNVPECSSQDGITGVTRDGMERSCATCPMNQWGSGEDDAGQATAGKACKEMRRVFFVLPGYQLPAFVSFPPTSLKSFDEYISARLTKGITDVAVETVATLTPEKAGKFSYAVGRFKLGDPVVPKEMMRLAKMRSAMQQAAESMGISEDDYMQDDIYDMDDGGEVMDENEPF